MKITCGTDIIEIERVKESIENLGEKFLERVYTKKEIEFGPVLLRNKDELFNELIINKISRNNYVINKLPKNKLIKKISLKINNHKLKKEMIQT